VKREGEGEFVVFRPADTRSGKYEMSFQIDGVSRTDFPPTTASGIVRQMRDHKTRALKEEAAPSAQPPAAGEDKAEGDCVPFVKIVRAEGFECGMERAKKIGAIDSPKQVWELIRPYTDELDTEIFGLIFCDVHGHARGVHELARGQRSGVSVGVNDVMRAVLASGCSYFLAFHTHPSSNSTASQADKDLTRDIEEACKPYSGEILFADHVVIGVAGQEVYSIKEKKKYKFDKRASEEQATVVQ
jgi:DNA repair protein RadC